MQLEGYEEAKAEMEKSIENQRKHLEDHKPLFRTAFEFGLTFAKKKYEYGLKEKSYRIGYCYGSGTVNCVYLDLFLGPEDSVIREAGPIIEEMKEHPRYKFYEKSDYLEAGWTGWDFRYTNGNGKSENAFFLPRLLIRAFFEDSNKCRKVGTGKYEEVMKLECDE